MIAAPSSSFGRWQTGRCPPSSSPWRVSSLPSLVGVTRGVGRHRQAQPDPCQIDIEDSIAASTSSGGEPDAAPLPDPDAPVPVSTSVSAPKAAQSRHPLYQLVSVDAAAGSQVLEHRQTGNTYRVSVEQLTGVE